MYLNLPVQWSAARSSSVCDEKWTDYIDRATISQLQEWRFDFVCSAIATLSDKGVCTLSGSDGSDEIASLFW